MTLLLLFMLLAIGVSFICSILEAVLLSVTPSYIVAMEADKPVLAKKLAELKKEVDRPLAAILSLNTVAHTVGAAGAGAQAAIVFGDTSLAIFSAVLTLLILVLSEIIPKTIGATFWKSLTPMIATMLPPLIWIMWPLVKLSQGITYLMGGSGEGAVSRAEIAAMADVGQRAGVVDEGESRIVRNLLQFNKLSAQDIMTPRTVVYALPQSTTVGEALDGIDKMRFSRIPIYGDTIDEITGFVLKTDILLKAINRGKKTTLEKLKRELLQVPADIDLQKLFEILLKTNAHLALVQDKYGGTAGVVSLEDVVETLIGLEIIDEADTIADLQALARSKWEERTKKRQNEN
ncbi:MAG: hemolysin [Hyphomicrobiales bacterium]|nr:MAG: hemolysin [Hyphomicrobiales bacterium]